ncbi:MAG: hypothetical protein K0S78_3767 [Thermomicrobiales bacterium]|jgi:hypothetical protein|nr:hypothetical protein [Thermomicrobiales bacterium]
MGEGRGGDVPVGAEPVPAAQLGSLRDFVVANLPLLAAIGGLLGLVTFVAAWPLYAGWVRPYVTFLLLAAAVLLWLELLAQWPADVLIYQGPPPPGTPWRLVGFAYAVQLTMVAFIGGFLWRIPRLVVPTLAAAIGIGLWRFLLPQRVKAMRGVPLLTLIIALLIAIAVVSQVHPTYWAIFADAAPSEP